MFEPVADPYKDVSPFLKRVVHQYGQAFGFTDLRCLDAPSGNGRNTFFLSEQCASVLAADIDVRGLAAISARNTDRIETLPLDLSSSLPDLEEFGLVCVIHFYHAGFLSALLAGLPAGAFVLIETPGCQGENFRTLPTEAEAMDLLAGQELLVYDFHACPHGANIACRGPLKAFLKRVI